MEELKSRKDRLVEAYLYESVIDNETYERQRRKLDEEIAQVEVEILDRSNAVLDIEEVLSFSAQVLSNTAESWLSFEPIESRIIYRQSKQREDCFQKAVIKRGLRLMRRSALRARSFSSP